VEAPRNGVRDHHRMDKTQYTGLVTVVILFAFAPTLIARQHAPVRDRGHWEEARVCADQASDRLMICAAGRPGDLPPPEP